MSRKYYSTIDAAQFINIVEGNAPQFIGPQYGTTRASWQMEVQARREAGLEVEESIKYPIAEGRYPDKVKYRTQTSSVPPEEWPDFDKPLINLVRGGVFWNRGFSSISGYKFKPELVFGIDLYNCHFDHNISIYEVQSKSYLIFRNCSLLKSETNTINITNSTFKTVELYDLKSVENDLAVSLETLDIENLDSQKLIIKDSMIQKVKITSLDKTIKQIIIDNCSIESIEIIGDDYEDCQILSVKGLKKFIFNGKSKNLEILGVRDSEFPESNCKIENIDLKIFVQEIKGNYTFNAVFVNNLSVTGISNSNILFTNSVLNFVNLINFSNIGELRLQNIYRIRKLIIKDSSLSKAEFLNVDLSKSKFTEIIRSNISEIVLINSVFPSILNDESHTIVNFSNMRDVFRQLKLASGKQGDRIQELRYEALEMRAYERDTVTEKSFADKFILFTNRVSNNHGQDWTYALSLLLFITCVTFGIVKYSLGNVPTLKWAGFGQISQYMNFALNPLHDFDKVFKSEGLNSSLLGLAKFVDSVTRLVSGYLIFQFFRAFRKFVR